ncbi:MAG: hypothetical protein L0323_10850 [Planctomycetes bacterium]|nr:hypothetical protein [Planctomycetota bacterium]
MKRRKPRRSRRRVAAEDPLPELDLYYEWWRGLTPEERLRRSWRLRTRIKDLQAFHDAKYLPEP